MSQDRHTNSFFPIHLAETAGLHGHLMLECSSVAINICVCLHVAIGHLQAIKRHAHLSHHWLV